jgi:hypothetical protein
MAPLNGAEMEQKAICLFPIPRRVNSTPRPATELVPISQIIPSCIKISRRRFRQLESISLIREQRQTGHQELAFNARPFVLCGIPLRPLPKDQIVYKRQNGKFSLHIVAHPDYGLPFGQDRLIPIWVATLALRQKSRTVHFETAAEMLDFFRMPKDGRYYRRLVAGFHRLFSATIFFGTEDAVGNARFVDWARFHFFDQVRLWFVGSAEQACAASNQCKNTITLSEAFYKEIDEHRIPAEREVVIALSGAPGVLDFYIWIAWKTWTLNQEQARIPLFTCGGLRDQLGCCLPPEERFFRRTILRWLRVIRAHWPQCPATISQDGHNLILNSSKQSPAIRPA